METKTNVGLVIGRVALLDGLKKLASVINGKTSLEILKGIKIVVTPETITLEGTNLYDIVRVTLKNENASDSAQYVIVYKSLTDFLKKSKAETVEIVGTNEHISNIKAGKINYAIASHDASLYPRIPQIECKEIVLTKDEFTKAIQNTSYAASTSSSRPVLKSVNVNLNKNGLSFVATDSHRLAQFELWNHTSDDTYCATPDAESLKKAVKIIDKKCESVTVGFNEQYTVLKFDNVEYFIHNIEGNYPDTSRLIPDEFYTELTLDVKEMIESLDVLKSMYVGERNHLVKIRYKENVELYADKAETGEGMVAELTCHNAFGESLEMAYNGKFMSEALSVMDTKDVEIKFNSNMRPFILKPEAHIIHLILPIRTF